ncbi:MAG: hypothetical protein Kow0077_17460 [Anaerolineae bacterium]
MFTNMRSYLPFIIIIAGALIFALVGFVTGLNAEPAPPPAPVVDEPVRAATASPQPSRPHSPPVSPPRDPRTLALSGEMGNGGYWTWDDIVNLLGVYGTPGQFVTRRLGNTTFSGVPLHYLLRYARVNPEADRLLITSRGNRQQLFAMRSVEEFQNYLIVAQPNGTLALVPPSGQEFAVFSELMGIQAALAEDLESVRLVAIPASPEAVLLSGRFARGGVWTWTDLSNLLSVYDQPGAYRTVSVAGGTYSGVPVTFLLDYARVTGGRVNTVRLYNRYGSEYMDTAALTTCETCVIARSESGTLTMVRPGKDPEVIFEFAVLNVP